MSFNRRAEELEFINSTNDENNNSSKADFGQHKAHSNKENIDAMISKFRIENQAFSNRV
jgi:hypothetical protein